MNSTDFRLLSKTALIAAAVTFAGSAMAATVVWTGGDGSVNLASNWSTSVIPGSADVADFGFGNATVTLDSNPTWSGLIFREPSTGITTLKINPGSTGTNALTLGAQGIDLTGTAAGVGNVEIAAEVKFAVDQVWRVAAGRTLNLSGKWTGAGNTVNINTDGSTGNVVLNDSTGIATINVGGGTVTLANQNGVSVNLTGSSYFKIAGGGKTQTGTYDVGRDATLEFIAGGASDIGVSANVKGSGVVNFNTTFDASRYGQYANISEFTGTVNILGLLKFTNLSGINSSASIKLKTDGELGFKYSSPVTIVTPISVIAGSNLKLAQYGAGALTINSTLSDVGSTADTVVLAGASVYYSTKTAVATLNSTITDMVAGKQTSLLVSGANWIVNGANTFTGGTTIVGDFDASAVSARTVGGALLLGGNSVLSSGLVQLNSGGRLASSDTTARILSNDISFKSVPTISNEQVIRSGSVFLGDSTRNGALTLNGNVTLGSNTILNIDSSATVSNGISGGSYTLFKQGPGQLTLSGHSTFTGALILGAGRTVIDSTGGPALDTKSLVFDGDSYFVLSSSNGSASNLIFNNTTLKSGNASILREGNATGYVDLGAIAFSGGSLDINESHFVKSTGLTNTSSGSLASSITYQGGLAKLDASGYITAYDGGYTDVPYLTGIIADRSGAPIRLITDVGSSGNVTLGAPVTRLDLLFQGQSSATTIRLGSNNLVFASGDGTIQVASDLTSASGALTIGIAGDSGTITSQNENAANAAAKLTFDNKSNKNPITVGNPIVDGSTGGTASVSLVKNGSGAVILAGTNTYTGTTTINAGTLQIGNGGTTGSIAVGTAIINNDALIYNHSDDITVSNVISGSGSLVKNGAGKLTLTGTNTYAGGSTNPNLLGADGNYYGTIINAGTLQIGNGGTQGSITTFTGAGSKAILNNGKIIFNNTSAVMVDSIIAGSGSLETKAGDLTLTAKNSFTGAITVGTGLTLTVSGSGLVGNAPVILNGSSVTSAAVSATINGALIFNSTGSSRLNNVSNTGGITNIQGANLISGSITGGGAITVSGGNLSLTGNNNFGSESVITIATSGKLTLGDATVPFLANGDLNGVTKSLINNGQLIIARGGNLYLNSIIGTGSVSVGGNNSLAGNTIFTQKNTYAGATTIVANGFLQLDGAGTLGSDAGAINMATYGGFKYNRNDSMTIANAFTGGGSLQTMQGALTLTGANTYMGGTVVGAGSTLNLLQNGAIANTAKITVNGILNLNTTESLTLGNTIDGTGLIHQSSTTGIVSLTGSSSFFGSYQIDSGTMIKVGTGSGSNSGTLAGASVNNGGSLIWNRSGFDTYGGSITGAGNVTIDGGIDITFTGANSYTGATTIISGSTLHLGNGKSTDLDSIISASIITNNGKLALKGADGASYSKVIQGAGAVLVEGPGRTTLTANNTFTGTISVTNGTLVAGSLGSLGAGSSITVNSTGGLDLNGNVLAGYTTLTLTKGTIGDTGSAGSIAAATFALQGGTINATLTGAGSVTKSTASTVVLNAAQSFTGGIALQASGGTLQIAGASSLSSGAYAGVIDLGASSTLQYSSSRNQTLSGVISGAGALNKDTSSSILTLTGANTYAGATTISAGTLQIGSGASGGSLGGTAVNNSAALLFDSSATTQAAGVISGTGTLTKQGTGTTVLTGANTYTGVTTITAGTLQVSAAGSLGGGNYAGAITDNGTFKYSSSAAQTLSGVISGVGTLEKDTGTGTLTITGAATYTGSTTISAGTVQVAGSGSLGGGNYAGAIIDNGTLKYSSSANQTLSGVISGTGTLVKDTGTGTLTLTGLNNYGSTTVSAGTLVLAATTAQPGNAANLGGKITVNSGATLDVTGNWNLGNTGLGSNAILANGGTIHSGADNYTNNLTLQNGAQVTADANKAFRLGGASDATVTVSGSSASTASSGFTLVKGDGSAGAPATKATFLVDDVTGNASTDFTVSGAIIDQDVNPGLALVKNGSGTMTLTAANTYAGATTIGAGTLQISGAGTLGNGTYAGAIANSGTLQYSGAANQTLSGVISGGGALVKDTGAGTLTLSGSNTYAGPTTVNAGKLFLNGSNTGTGTISVASGAVLGGTGSGASAVTIATGGTLLGGVGSAASGTLSIGGNVTLSSGSVIQLVLGASGAHSSLAGTGGAWTFANTQQFEFLNAGYRNESGVLAYNDIITGIASDPGISGWTVINSGGYQATFTYDAANKAIDLSLLSASIFWDGTSTGPNADGGNGTWNTTASNWQTAATGGTSVAFGPGSNVVFGGAAGIVQLSASAILDVTNVQFSTTGYQLSGGTLRFGNGGSLVVDSGVTARIDSALAVQKAMAVFGGGKLILGNASNVFSVGGTLTVSGNTTLEVNDFGAISGAQLSFGAGGAILSYTGASATLSSFNVSGLGSGDNTFNISNGGTTVTLSNALSAGSGGGVFKSGAGKLVLTGQNTYTAATSISEGTLTIGSAGNLAGGNYAGTISNNGIFQYSGTAAQTLSGVISGTGALVKDTGAGTLTLTGADTYTGSTTISAGTLQVAGAGSLGGGNYAGAITNSGTFQYSGTAAQTLSGVISGAGALVKDTGAGTLTLTGADTYTGSTTISAGTLQVAGAGTLGAGGNYAGAITNNGTFTYSSSANQTLSGVISGTGALVKDTGTGTLTVTGADTYTGNTTISAGTLQVAGAGTLGTGGNYAGAINNNGAFQYSGTAAQTLSGVISGTGSLMKDTSASTLTLTGADTYTGTTTISAGTLQVAGAGTLGGGNYAGAIANSGTFQYSGTANQTLSGVISGTGALVKDTGTGILTVTGADTYTGNTTISSGTLQVAGAGTLGAGGTYAGAINNNGTFTYSSSANQTLSGVISGTGALVKDTGTGTLTVTGADTYTGNTTISAGTLQVAGAGTLGTGGTYAKAITNDGTFQYSGTANQTLSGVISGSGALIKDTAESTLKLTGANAYSGATTIGAGTLQVAGAGTLGGGTYAGAIVNSGTFQYSGTANQTLSGMISGSGALLKDTAASTLTLTGSNAYSGATTVSAGKLLMNGTNNGTGLVTVASGAVLGGTGYSASGVNIATGGTLLGGAGATPLGTLSIGGNVTLASGSIIQLVLGASGVNSSLTATGGAWVFDGAQKFSFIDTGATVGNYTGLITGIANAPSSINNWTIANVGYAGKFSWNASTNAVDLVLTAVPEPSTYGLIGAGALASVAFVARRRRHALARK